MSPRISVFMPEHKPDQPYLAEAIASVLAQTYEDWELVLVVPSGAVIQIPPDDRVKVAACDCVLEGVGSAKSYAVANCSGEILVELDHDDILMPTALQRIVAAFDANPNAALVYSDFAQINADGSPNLDRFREDYGWEYHWSDSDGEWATRVTGRHYLVCHAPEPTPHNVSYIWYAPNHVRAFTRVAYDKSNGYDAERKVLDDQDLMMQLYRVGEFVHVNEPLYLQRMHDENTQRQADTNAFIQQDTVVQYDNGINAAALAWAERRGLLAVELGCGENLTPGYHGFDLVHGEDVAYTLMPDGSPSYLRPKSVRNPPGAITKWDLSVDIPLPDNSVGVIRAVDFLEHLPHSAGIMAEIHRVLAPNGLLLSLTPSTDGRGAFQDPTHVSFWNENSFWYYTDERYAGYSPQNAGAPRFQVSRLQTYFPSDWHAQHQISYVCANLIAVKDGYVRDGGPLLWGVGEEGSPSATM